MKVKVTEEKNWTYAVRSQMFECVLPIVFIILATQQHMKTNELHIFQTFEIENVDQGLGVQFSHRRHSMANVKIYKRHFFTFFIFAEIRPVRTKVTDRQTNKQTDTQKRTSQ